VLIESQLAKITNSTCKQIKIEIDSEMQRQIEGCNLIMTLISISIHLAILVATTIDVQLNNKVLSKDIHMVESKTFIYILKQKTQNFR